MEKDNGKKATVVSVAGHVNEAILDLPAISSSQLTLSKYKIIQFISHKS